MVTYNGSGSGGGGSGKNPQVNENGRWLLEAQILPELTKKALLSKIENKKWDEVKLVIPKIIAEHGREDSEHNLNALHVMVDMIESGKKLKEIRGLLMEYEMVVAPLFL